MESGKGIRVKCKPRMCPNCGSARVASILYGMPTYSDKLSDDLEAGRVVLGDCCVGTDKPVWQCVDCKTDLFRKDDIDLPL